MISSQKQNSINNSLFLDIMWLANKGRYVFYWGGGGGSGPRRGGSLVNFL